MKMLEDVSSSERFGDVVRFVFSGILRMQCIRTAQVEYCCSGLYYVNDTYLGARRSDILS